MSGDDIATRLALVVAAAHAQMKINEERCPQCGGDSLRPAFDGRGACHVAWPTGPDNDNEGGAR